MNDHTKSRKKKKKKKKNEAKKKIRINDVIYLVFI